MNCIFADHTFILEPKSAISILNLSRGKSFVDGSTYKSGDVAIRLDWLTISISDGVFRVCISHKEFQSEVDSRINSQV